MTKKSYEMYLRMIKLACNNLKRELVEVNSFSGPECISIRIRSKNKITKIVESIVYSPKMAVLRYAAAVNNLFVVSSTEEFLHDVHYGKSFVESILRERESRVAQKRLIELLAAEKYLSIASEYDKVHDANGSVLKVAKKNIINVFSLNFLSNFSFVNNVPELDDYTRKMLEKRAFDKQFSLVSSDTVNSAVDRCFFRKLAVLNDDFLELTDDEKGIVDNVLARDAAKKSKKSSDHGFNDVLVAAQVAKKPVTVFGLVTDVDKFPTKTGKLRKVANLKSENSDIWRCSEKQLAVKKQFAEIEARSKRAYIYSYFTDTASANRPDYYYQKEQEMYHKIRQVDGPVKCANHKLYFPDGITIKIDFGLRPYEMLHRVNCILAAMFGFTNRDSFVCKNWLEGTIRSAYTDEGVAEYRLECIRQRMEVK